MPTKKRSKRMPKPPADKKHHYWAVECPECGYFTWMWTTLEGAYNEIMDHIEGDHDGVADFEIVRLGDDG